MLAVVSLSTLAPLTAPSPKERRRSQGLRAHSNMPQNYTSSRARKVAAETCRERGSERRLRRGDRGVFFRAE